MIFLINNTEKAFMFREKKTSGKFDKKRQEKKHFKNQRENINTSITYPIASFNGKTKFIGVDLQNIYLKDKNIESITNPVPATSREMIYSSSISNDTNTFIKFEEKNLNPVVIRNTRPDAKDQHLFVIALALPTYTFKGHTVKINSSTVVNVINMYINKRENKLFLALNIPFISDKYNFTLKFVNNTDTSKSFGFDYNFNGKEVSSKFVKNVDVNDRDKELEVFRPVRATYYLLIKRQNYYDLVRALAAGVHGIKPNYKYKIVRLVDKYTEPEDIRNEVIRVTDKLKKLGAFTVTYFTQEESDDYLEYVAEVMNVIHMTPTKLVKLPKPERNNK